MTLAALQQEFMAHVLDEDRPLPPRWDARMGDGLAIYRNAYRSRLVDALRETFPKTAQWVGDNSFAQAAAHHLITHPPRGWTLDLVGEGFVGTLEGLFANDPDVADLGWLEWAMHLAFSAADCEPLDAARFAEATRGFDENDWTEMRLVFVPSLHHREVSSDCTALWLALEQEEPPDSAPTLESLVYCKVWREGLSPVFRLIERDEGQRVAAMMQGATFGDLCASLDQVTTPDETAAAAGGMLGRWLAAGLVVDLSR